MYTLQAKPDVKTIAAINDDYAFGRDSWEMYSHAIKKLKPDVQFTEVLWPKAFIGEYSAEIAKLPGTAASVDINSNQRHCFSLDKFVLT